MEPKDFVYFIGTDFDYYGMTFTVHSVTMFGSLDNEKRELIVAKNKNDNSVHSFIYAPDLFLLEYYGDFDDIDSAYPETRDWLTATNEWARI